MFPSCHSKPAESGAKRRSVAQLLLGVFVIYALHTVWLLYGFLHTRPCDGARGEHCVTSYLAARPRLQVSRPVTQFREPTDSKPSVSVTPLGLMELTETRACLYIKPSAPGRGLVLLLMFII